jgi:hypothetical protein
MTFFLAISLENVLGLLDLDHRKSGEEEIVIVSQPEADEVVYEQAKAKLRLAHSCLIIFLGKSM